MMSFCCFGVASNPAGSAPRLDCEIASFSDAPFAPTARPARTPVGGLGRDDAGVAQCAAIASLGHRVLLLLVWPGRGFQAARPRGGNPAVDRARVALGPKALDIPTRPLGVTMYRRPHHGAVPATASEFPAPKTSCASSPPGVNDFAWEFRLSGTSRMGYHIVHIICRMGAWVFQGDLRGVIHHSNSKASL